MPSTTVARRYAKAIVEIGRESGNLDGLVEEIVAAAQVYSSSQELRSALENPIVTHEAKRAIVADIGDHLGLRETSKNTLLLLNERRRMSVLPDIAQLLKEMTDQERGIVRAVVTSAVQLSEDYYTRLQNQLEKMTGKRIVLDRRQDESLIAGVITRIGDTIVDGSLRTRLQEMKTALISDPAAT